MLQELLGSQARAEILRKLFTPELKTAFLRELSRMTGLSAPVLQRELRQLVSFGIIVSEKDGNRINFSANRQSSLYPVLCELVKKTDGEEAQLRAAFQDCEARFVFLFGSFAKGTAKQGSDIDLFVIGDCGLREVSKRIHTVADNVSQEINPYVISVRDFLTRKNKQDHFITEMLTTPKIFLKGSADEFDAMVK
ncbi:MAG: nucleotidyltransferase domain-containing protein [Lentisphaeria bacterium]|nr:nucleotidyltransferase domain-containing protein [Lentisphaeria bacterium]